VDAEELVMEYPLGLNHVVRVAAHDLSCQLPGAGQVIDQIVVPPGWSLRARAEGDQHKQKRPS
jgi:hypothetical protein